MLSSQRDKWHLGSKVTYVNILEEKCGYPKRQEISEIYSVPQQGVGKRQTRPGGSPVWRSHCRDGTQAMYLSEATDHMDRR